MKWKQLLLGIMGICVILFAGCGSHTGNGLTKTEEVGHMPEKEIVEMSLEEKRLLKQMEVAATHVDNVEGRGGI